MVTKLMKKGVSLLLCAAILIASTFSLSFTAFAAGDDEEEFPEAAKIVINTEFGNGTTLLKEDGYVNAQVEITDADGSVLSDSAQIKVRGNTTAQKALYQQVQLKKECSRYGQRQKMGIDRKPV